MKIARKIARVILFLLKGVLILLVLGLIYLTAVPLWNRFVVYPGLEKERAVLWGRYKKPEKHIAQTDYKGVLHSHTYRSHDSRGILAEIIPAARQAKLNFIFLADHRRAELDTFPRGYNGIFEGIVVEPGTESPGASMMVNPMRKTVLDWRGDRNKLMKDVVDQGGMVFYLHSEDTSHDWGNPDYQGMEIYNIHTDLIDEKNPAAFLINGMINSGKYRHWSYRELFDEQNTILARWDSLNRQRKIVGMAAVDAHNNQSIRARYLKDGQVEWVGSNSKTLKITKPGWKEKLLLGEPDVAGWAFKMELDTYFHSFNFVNTHVFSDSLSARAIRNNVVNGHAYISFESLAEATGFEFFATDSNHAVNAIMGDSIPSSSVGTLEAVSPYPVRFELFKDGKRIDQTENSYTYKFKTKPVPGNYRIVARLLLGKDMLPWVYTNPIYIY